MWWVAKDLKLGAGVALGFLVAALLFGGVSALGLGLLALLRGRLEAFPMLRFAISGVVRRRAATIAQISALAIGMMALLLLTIVRTDLLAGWQRTLPPDAPNRFLINVQSDQVPGVRQALQQAGIPQAVMSPMVRGRLLSRNGQALSANDYTQERAQRLIEREFNLSYAPQLPEPGQIVAGRDLVSEAFEVSLETGLAKTLSLALGDVLEFDIAGQMINVTVTSLRRVDWDSMRANFFAILTPAALSNAPQTFMTAFHLRPDQAGQLQKLVQEFPNLTVFDVGAILGQLQSILDKVSVAVQGLFVFSLLAGALVLAAALSATRDERVREAALMRALGASRRQLATAQRIELLAVGALAGLLAAGGATLAAWALSTWLFEFNMRFTLLPWVLGVTLCMFGAWLAGALALRGVLQTPPLNILRQT
jgi:putative ABC transport system permease protein